MNYIVTYKNGNLLSSSDCAWRNIKADNIESIGIYDNEDKYYELKGDVFFFSDVADFSMNSQKFIWKNRTIGAFDKKSKKGQIITVWINGGTEIIDADLKEYESTHNHLAFKYA